ncbi:type II secretion system major pseudopilin GspG [Kamptonema cortianum]|nr:type II secretion system major pseudopilin GspG [Geitlerinema splendidum]MDK3156012.1 type II secretion system major pseudopilin GspG [Kamptonema cortianum]
MKKNILSKISFSRKNKAFTLIELLVVILILAILAAMIVPRIVSRTSEAKQSKARGDLVNLRKMLETYRLDVGAYPSTEEGLEALRTPPADAEGWKGPYLTKPIPNDPWNNPYYYEWPGPDGDESYVLLSYGSDGQPDGTGEAEDIIESGE